MDLCKCGSIFLLYFLDTNGTKMKGEILMPQHYRHYRVAGRHKSCMSSPFDQFVNELKKQPLLLFCLIFLLFILFIKCIACN